MVPFCGEFVAGFNVDDVLGEGLVEWVGTAGGRVRIECGTCVQWRLPSVADHIVGRNVSNWAIVGLKEVSEFCLAVVQQPRDGWGPNGREEKASNLSF